MQEGVSMFHSVKTRTVATFLVVVVIVLVVCTIVSFIQMNRQEQDAYEGSGLGAAQACATMVDYAVTDVDDFRPGDQDYDECRESLRTLCRVEGMAYMYVYTVDEANGTMTYIMAVSGDPERDATISQARPYGTVVPTDHLSKKNLDATQGKNGEYIATYNNAFGSMVDCMAPVGETGMFAAASYSLTEETSNIVMSALSVVAHIIFALLLLLVGQLIMLRRNVMNPLQTISERMKNFTPQHARDFESVGITSKDELGEIARSFEHMAGDIADYLDHIEQMTQERVQVDVELDVARRIQQGMVPETKSVEGAGSDVFAFSRSAKDVGGDFYDVIERDDGSTAIVIGDVSGKGVAAALFMAMSKEAISAELLTGKDPASTLMSVNNRLCHNNPEGMFVTALIALMDRDGHVTFANAGHLHPVRVLDEAVEVACEPGCLMGLFDDVEIDNEALDLEPGEALLLYTDGASEAVNARQEFLGEETIKAQLSKRAPFADARDVLDELVGIVDGFAAQAEQFDDLTAIALMRHPRAGSSRVAEDEADGTRALQELDVDISSFAAIREGIMDGPEKQMRLKACLACEEAFANIVSYSKAKHISYDVSERDGLLTVVLADDGVPFDPLMADSIEKEFEELEHGGMGIALAKEIASDLSYKRSAGRNVLTLQFELGASDSCAPRD